MDELPIREEKLPEDPSKIKRLASLDFQRGLAIWMMVFLHVFNHMIDYSSVDAGQLFSGVPPYTFINSAFFAFSGYFGNWIGYFIIISAIVNAYATTKKALAGFPPGKLFAKQIVTGFGILLAGVITESFGYYGYFGSVISSGNFFQAATWTDPANVAALWQRFFLMEALQIIGWCMILTAIIQYFLYRRDGVQKFTRNLIILGVLTLLIFILSPVIWHFVDNWAIWKPVPGTSPGDYHYSWPSDQLQAYNHSFLSWFMTIIAGDYYPLFPYLGQSLLGAIMGVAIAHPKPHRKLPWMGFGLFLALLIAGGLCAWLLPFDISFERPTMGFFFFLMAEQVGAIVLRFYLIDWRGKGERFANNIVMKYFRTWGMVALTIFALQIWSFVPRAIFNWTIPSMNLLSEQFPAGDRSWIVLIFAIVTILFYDLLIWLWAQINFIGTFEWIIIKLGVVITKQPSKRLNFKYMLNEVAWMNYQPLISTT